jgi:uncharacterized protein YktB (UPF0637 family)
MSDETPSIGVLDKQFNKTYSLIVNGEENISSVTNEIEKLERMSNSEPDFYIISLYQIANALAQRNDVKWTPLVEYLSRQILSKKTDVIRNKGWQINAIVNYLLIDSESFPSHISNTRKSLVNELLSLWECVLNNVAVDGNSQQGKVVLQPYFPPNTYKGPFIYGMSPESITDNKVKQEYAEYLEKRNAILKKNIDQNQASDVLRVYKDHVRKYIVSSYSIRPFAITELELLLKEHKIDDDFTKSILDAVELFEKNAPPVSDYRNWESTDGLFKTNAKFISLDKKEVTLEKANGKQTTIELSALRKVDQDYVEEQLAPKPETPKTGSSP